MIVPNEKIYLTVSESQELNDIVARLSRFVNRVDLEKRAVAHELYLLLAKEHRTLQQVMIEIIVNTLMEYAQEARMDERNKAAQKVCGRVRRGVLSPKYEPSERGSGDTYLGTDDYLNLPFI